MTDERIGDALLPLIRTLPPGAGVVFRHRSLPRRERYRLFLAVRRLAQARRLRITAAGHLPGAPGHGGAHALTHPVHHRREAVAALRAGAALIFVSPLYPTRSHPGAAALGTRRAVAIARDLPVERIALGGMTARRWLALRRYGFDGWAAIDGLTGPTGCPRGPDQKRKAVPT